MVIFANVNAFFLDPVYLQILEATLALFAAMAVLWWAYIKLSKRDLFELAKPDKKVTTWTRFVYGLKYIFVFPILTFFWFVLFVLCLRLLSDATPESIMFFGIVLVSTVRIAAFVSERMAEDLAKMMPLALLATVLMDPSFQSLNISFEQFTILQQYLPGFIKYLLFIVVLELVLKFGHHISARIRGKK